MLVLACAVCVAQAKTYKVFMGTAPGSASDIQTRKLFDEVGKETGDNFVVINRPGAGFLVSYRAFIEESRTNPDVILFYGTGGLSLVQLGPPVDIDPLNELKGLMALQKVYYFVVVRSDSKYNTPADLKGKTNVGTVTTLSEFLVKRYMSQADLQTVAYKSENESMFALLKNEIDAASSNNNNTLLITHRDKLRVIRPFPDSMVGVVGYHVIKNFPEDEKQRLNRAMNKVLKSPGFTAWMRETTGYDPEGGTGELYDELWRHGANEVNKLKNK